MLSTPLRNAIENGHYDACVLLLEHGAYVNNVNIDTNGVYNYESPLYIAVEYNRLEICRLLMDHGADVYGVNNARYGDKCLICDRAAEYHYMDICELLLRGDLRNDVDYSLVLCYAIDRKRHSLAKRLIRHGTDIESCLGYASYDDGITEYYKDFADTFIMLLADVLYEYRSSKHNNNDTE
jgi:ankyrin repeat protein